MRWVISLCDPCEFNFYCLDEFGDCKEDVCMCPKEDLKEKCWIEQWAKELEEKMKKNRHVNHHRRTNDKTLQLNIRISPSEYEMLVRVCTVESKSFSSLIRDMIAREYFCNENI